jgi:phosphate transport system substrate-binding protein
MIQPIDLSSRPACLAHPGGLARRLARFAILALILRSTVAGVPMAWGETLRLGGTGSALATMKQLAEAFHKRNPQFAVTIVPSLGSSGGIKALAAGALDIAVISRPLESEEAAQGMVAREYGRTPFVLVTNQKGLTRMTLQQVADIVAGRVTKWPDGTPIRLVLRPTSDYDTTLWANFSPGMKQALASARRREGMVVAMTDQDAADEIDHLPGAFGVTSLALVMSEKRRFELITLDGVTPTVRALADNRYPYFKIMSVVTRGDGPAAAQGFIDYLRSREARAVLARTGHWATGDRAPRAGNAAR